MRQILCQIMLNDSLREEFRNDYHYMRGLHLPDGEAYVAEEDINDKIINLDGIIDAVVKFLGHILKFLIEIPAFVWILLGCVLAALLFVWMYRNGLFGSYRQLQKQAFNEADNIYEINFTSELEQALARGDYDEALRIRYLSTLRTLVDKGRVEWKIFKTPAQYAREVHNSSFSKLTQHFLRVRYGKYTASESLYRSADSLAQTVEKEEGGES